MAQPPLSQAIQRLEAQVGAPAGAHQPQRGVDAGGRGIPGDGATHAGGAGRRVAQARRVAQGMEGHLTATLSIFLPESLLRGLRRFRAAHPAVSFTLREATTRAGRGAGTGRADIGLMRHPGVSAPSLHFETLLSEPVLIACQPRTVWPNAMWWNWPRSGKMRSWRRRARSVRAFMTSWCRCAWRRASRRVAQEARRLETVVALVAGGFGAALLPARWREPRGDVVFRPISVDAGALRRLDLLLAWRAGDASPIRDSLIAALREATRPVGRRRRIAVTAISGASRWRMN